MIKATEARDIYLASIEKEYADTIYEIEKKVLEEAGNGRWKIKVLINRPMYDYLESKGYDLIKIDKEWFTKDREFVAFELWWVYN